MGINSESKANDTPVSRPLVSDAIVIAVMTTLSYGLGYCYEVGIADEFGIPVELISVDTATLLKAGGVLGGFLVALYFIIDTVAVFVPRGKHPWSSDVTYYLASYIFSLVLLYLSVSELKTYIFVTCYFIFVGLVYAVWPIFFGSKELSYRERYVEVEAAERKVMSRSITSTIVSNGGSVPALLVILCVLILYVSNQLGHNHAKTQEEYFLVTTSTNNVVLGIYGDVFVTSIFDPCTKKIVGPLLVQKLTEKSEVSLSQLNVGPLTVDHEKKSTMSSDFDDGG